MYFGFRDKSLTLALVLVASTGLVHALEPIADIHLHYKWSQAGVTSPEQAIGILREQNVTLAVVIGTPPEYALRLEALDAERIVPVYGPYNEARNWFSWVKDPELVSDARKALASGQYHGIGELHLIGGFAPKRSQVIEGLLEIAAEFSKPLLIHTEFSSPKPLLRLCRKYPGAPILWAHAGGILEPKDVRLVMEQCPSVSAELAARDPWRYVNNPIADTHSGRLLPQWERLVMDYANRFLVGSDPVWPVDKLDGWDQDDTGWQEIGRFLEFHRRWLSFLPKRERELITRTNAQRLFYGSDM